MNRSLIDQALLLTAIAVLIAAFIVSAISRDAFATYFGLEDSLVENATALLLALAGCVLIVRAIRHKDMLSTGALILGILYGLAYLWAGGEEISWGQRIFGFESPDYFAENNDQGEFTLHNLVIGDVKLDELLFGPVISVIILSYLIILPLLWPRVGWVQSIAKAMIIPVPRPQHAVLALLVTLIIPLLGESRRWEVYECIFALLSLAIFLHPANPLPKEQD